MTMGGIVLTRRDDLQSKKNNFMVGCRNIYMSRVMTKEREEITNMNHS